MKPAYSGYCADCGGVSLTSGTECIWNSKDAVVPEVGDSPLRGEHGANCP